MRFLLVNEEPSAHLYARALADTLLARGHEVFLSSPLPGLAPDAMPRAVLAGPALAGFGLQELWSGLGTHLTKLRRLHRFIRDEQPERTVLIDYGGFNMILGRLVWRLTGLHWFIPPKVWAWGAWRARVISRFCPRIHCLFPFELPVWRRAGARPSFHGHPLVEMLPPPARKRETDLVCLLPGSRPGELAFSLPLLAELHERLCRCRPGLRFAVLAADSVDDEALRPLQRSGLRWVRGEERLPLLARATAAVAVSGTVVLEAALLGTPLVAFYSLKPLSTLLARHVLRIRRVTLPNILLGMDLIPEFVQEELNPCRIGDELEAILDQPGRRIWMETQYARLRQLLGGGGAAMERLADALLAESGVVA